MEWLSDDMRAMVAEGAVTLEQAVAMCDGPPEAIEAARAAARAAAAGGSVDRGVAAADREEAITASRRLQRQLNALQSSPVFTTKPARRT